MDHACLRFLEAAGALGGTGRHIAKAHALILELAARGLSLERRQFGVLLILDVAAVSSEADHSRLAARSIDELALQPSRQCG